MGTVTVKAIAGTPEQRDIARQVVRWFATTGMPIRRNIHVTVRFVTYLPNYDYASVTWNGRSAYQATRFAITVNANNHKRRKALVRTLCHEMVHVRQMAHRRLLERLEVRRGKEEYRTLWVGKDKTTTAYAKQPWENEAFAMENRLADRFYAYAGY